MEQGVMFDHDVKEGIQVEMIGGAQPKKNDWVSVDVQSTTWTCKEDGFSTEDFEEVSNHQYTRYPEDTTWEIKQVKICHPKVEENKMVEEIGFYPSKRHIKLTAKVSGHNTYFCVYEGTEMISQLKTGVGSNEMALFFTEYMIPFRDLFERLGFTVTEEVATYDK